MSVTFPGVASPDADGTGLRAAVRHAPPARPVDPWASAAILSKISERIPTEAAAYEYLEHQRWCGTPACPHCGVVGAHVFLRPANGLSRTTNRGKQSERRVWKCRDCKRQFSVITGTVMHGTHVPIRTWVLVSFEVAAGVARLTERDVARRYGLSSKSAHFLLQRIRDDLSRPAGESLFATVASDDTALLHALDHRAVVGAQSDASPLDGSPREPQGIISMW